MLELSLALLLAALSLYVLFGGADFGGGLLEASLRGHPELQRKLQKTLAPVWEANHVWLVAVVVILFMGFPRFYAALSVQLFVPLCLALCGIILRGAFFTFRAYDPQPERRAAVYSLLFRLSSFLTPMCYGMIAVALLGDFPATGTAGSFGELYVEPWASPLGLLGGCFTALLFGYLSAVFFHGELESREQRAILRTRIMLFFLATFLAGGAVLVLGALQGLVDPAVMRRPLQWVAHGLALLAIPGVVLSLDRRWRWGARACAALQVLAILGGWFAVRAPVLMSYSDGSRLTPQNASAPAVTLFWMNTGLLVVLALVLPLLAWLYRVFDRHADKDEGRE